ncbi:MAG: UpxY family transcription antiterminator [Clostridium sp.]|nr:UpxY family transcription antiterminator [Prevotella sp.]MCM1429160.1 UpxY family transcription antiterminator [Clostridium sp.]MCM1475312.1 UpxY family transcription antiterminator [Muribaculaceae bacterium]
MSYIDSEEPKEYLGGKDAIELGMLCGSSRSLDRAGALEWFALSAPYRREMRARELFESLGIETFVPMQQLLEETAGGRRKRTLRPAVPNLLFARSTRSQLQAFKTQYPIVQYITRPIDGRNEPIIVPDRQMEDFRRAITKSLDTILYFKPSEIDLSKGKRVRIIGGVLNGVSGTLMKVKGARSRRLVIMLEGLGAVAAEVEPDYIELI